jgi:hypothetical protein
MSSESMSMAKSVREELENLLELVMDDSQERQTADQVERSLWKGILVLGRMLMQLFFTAQNERETRHKYVEEEGINYAYAGQPSREYVSLFGSVEVKRHYYWKPGLGGKHPLDEKLSIPERIYSDCVQELMGAMEVWIAQDKTLELIKDWFELDIPKKSLQDSTADQAAYVAGYYAQQAAPEVGEQDTILVVTADGKGIPMTRQDSPPPEARRSRGQKKTAKKEATVTALYTISAYNRHSDDIIRALLPGQVFDSAVQSSRPTPTGKQVFGTLAGQAAAFEHLVEQVGRRDSSQLIHYVALTDGDRGLKKQVQRNLPQFTLIVDIMHVMEYLWEAAHTLLGETHFMRETWMHDALRCLLEDDLDRLLNHLEQHSLGVSKRKRATLNKVINYLLNNRAHMDYQSYLAQGYPIGTGVIEGTCRHLVKDRFEQTGMHWSLQGAQVMLDLRATHLNGDWVDFQKFRRHQVHQQRYGSLHPDVLPKEIMLSVAA